MPTSIKQKKKEFSRKQERGRNFGPKSIIEREELKLGLHDLEKRWEEETRPSQITSAGVVFFSSLGPGCRFMVDEGNVKVNDGFRS